MTIMTRIRSDKGTNKAKEIREKEGRTVDKERGNKKRTTIVTEDTGKGEVTGHNKKEAERQERKLTDRILRE